MEQQHQASEESVVALREQGLRLLKEGDYVGAARALEAAATRGDACAQNAFGVMHDGMFGLTRDWEAYIHWISLAAEQQYTPAFYNLGFVYEAGLGREASLPQALAWYTKGARLGHLASTQKLIDHYNGRYAFRYFFSLGPLRNLYAAVWRRRLARRGDATEQYLIGKVYEDGTILLRSFPKAMMWHRLAAAQGNQDAKVRLESLEKRWKEAETKLPELTLVADQGKAQAQLELGQLYATGLGVQQNIRKGIALMVAAAEQGDTEAAFVLGSFANTSPFERILFGDPETWFRKASTKGCLKATRALLDLYTYKKHKSKDDKQERKRLLRLAAEQGDEYAQKGLKSDEEKACQQAKRLREALEGSKNGEADAMHELFSLSRYYDDLVNKEEGRLWLLKAVEKGSWQAKESLASCFRYGWDGFEKSATKASALYLELAEHYYSRVNELDAENPLDQDTRSDWSETMIEIADRYAQGIGITQSDEQALLWYRRATKLEAQDAWWRIGQFHEAGRGGAEQSYAKALECYHHAFVDLVYLGDIVKYGVVEMEDYDFPVISDDPVAAAWYRKAADAGDSDAQWLIGIRLQRGLGVKKDVVAAADYLKQSAAQGNVIGMTFLGLAYWDGIGLPYSMQRAATLFREADVKVSSPNDSVYDYTFPGTLWMDIHFHGEESEAFVVENGENYRLFPEEV